MAVEETVGEREFRETFEEALSRPTPLLVTGKEWELTITGDQPLVRVSIGRRRWPLLLHCAKWSRARRAAAEMIASGESVARELLLYRRPQRGARSVAAATVCKMVAWLPRKPSVSVTVAKPRRLQQPRERTSSLQVWNRPIEQIDILNLRRAIRSNWISFPSQPPIFPLGGRPDLQRQLVQLYFVLGWGTAKIAARYRLPQQQVQRILNAWKTQAARAGYIQHIPPADAIPNWRS